MPRSRLPEKVFAQRPSYIPSGAVRSDPDDPSPTCIDKNCDDIKDKDPAQRYRIRTVDTADLFPSAEGKDTTDPTKTGRTPGFNWTVNATNLKNKNYQKTY